MDRHLSGRPSTSDTQLVEQSRALLSAPLASWDEAKQPLLSAKLGEFSHLMQRVDPKKIEAMIEDSKPETPPAAEAAAAGPADDGAALAAEPERVDPRTYLREGREAMTDAVVRTLAAVAGAGRPR